MDQLADKTVFADLVDRVSSEIRRKIMAGELPAGIPLRQRQLADAMGVSREPIKHAMRALHHEGLVVKRPRRSAIVAPIRAKLVQDVYQVRTALEALVARNVAALPEARRKSLQQELEKTIDRASRQENAAEVVELDRRFHLSIYEAAGNEVALSAYHSSWNTIGRAISLLVSTNHRERSWGEHINLVGAIAAGDAERAARLSEEHCRNASIWLIRNASHLMTDDGEAVSDEELLLEPEEEGYEESN